MNLPSYFKEFLGEIEPSPSYQDDQQAGHRTLRSRLAADADFKTVHINSFLQGSYKRKTAIHPGKDVDIVVVASIDPDVTTPSAANARLRTCLDRYYDKVRPQTRSFCVELTYVQMDVVLATSRALRQDGAHHAMRSKEQLEDLDAWVDQPLLIPDREKDAWVATDPKRQLEWTTAKNAATEGYFVPAVKMFKWWRKEAYQEPRRPKGYVLERVVGECFDVNARDHAEGFVQLLRNVEARFRSYALTGTIPFLTDPGIPANNVAARLTGAEFGALIQQVQRALPVAEAALAEPDRAKSATLWRQLFGSKFPAATQVSAGFPNAPVRPPNKPAGFA